MRSRCRGAIAACAVMFLLASTATASELADAAKRGGLTAVRTLIAQKADVNERMVDGTTAIHWAAKWDDLEMANLLIAAGADVATRSREGATPLFLAATNGNAAMIQALIKAGADPFAPVLPNGETALMVASRTGKVDAVKALLDHGVPLEAREYLSGTTGVMWAAVEGHVDVIKLLAERGANLTARSSVVVQEREQGFDDDDRVIPPSRTFQEGFEAIHYASREGHLNAVQTLVDLNVSPDETTANGASPLLLATENGHLKVGMYLVENGANPNIQNNQGWNPLYLAVKARSAETGTVPLRVDPAVSHLDYITFLLENGADPNLRLRANTLVRNSFQQTWMAEAGATPFFRAAWAADVTVMRLLLKYDADPKIATNDNTTPLIALSGVGFAEGFSHVAPEKDTIEAIELLLELGADVNAANKNGLTPLHGAAHRGDNTIVQLLVNKGADLLAKDNGRNNDRDIDAGVVKPLIPLEWAQGIPVGPSSAIRHSSTVDLIIFLMQAKGFPIPKDNVTLGGDARQ